MKAMVKNIIIVILVVIIILMGGYFTQYNKNVNSAINDNIRNNLNLTSMILYNINKDLTNYDNDKISLEEFRTILDKNAGFSLSINLSDTNTYKSVSKNLEYIDISDFNYYIMALLHEGVPEDQVEYHVNNIQKICGLWESIELQIEGDYFKASPELKKILDETNKLTEEGFKRLDETNK